MKSRVWVLLACVFCFCSMAYGQSPAKRQQVLQVSTGGFISFKSETSAIDAKRFAESQSLASLLYSQALTDENRIIHRVISDSDRRIIFGYDLWVNSDPITRKFRLAVMPADEAFRRSFLKESALRTSEPFVTFPKSTNPQTLDDGDAVSLELLVNEQSGVKIVDVVRVTFDRATLIERSLESIPKDFTLDAVALAVRRYELLIDGSLVGKGKSTVGCSGSLLWFYVPNRGRFIFSLVPREGYSFDKIGVIDGNRIEFVANGEHYEWISSESVLPNGGTWNLWVLQDPSYSPLFGPSKPIRNDNDGPSVLDKIKDVFGREPKPGLAITNKMPSKTASKTVLTATERVMVGGAEGMAHLLPKTP